MDASAVVGRQWKPAACLYTVIAFDAPRCVEFRLLSPGGLVWKPRSRLDARAWLAGGPAGGRRRDDSGGHGPLPAPMIQAAVGDCESWRRIWMAPRLADVTGRTAARQAAYRPAAERWPAHEAGLRELFVLGE